MWAALRKGGPSIETDFMLEWVNIYVLLFGLMRMMLTRKGMCTYGIISVQRAFFRFFHFRRKLG